MNDGLIRLENNEYALEISYGRLQKCINNSSEKDIYSNIGELLLWVLTTDEWHWKYNDKSYKNRRNGNENGKVIPGLRHAYNLMKHNMDFYSVHIRDEGGIEMNTFQFPLIIPGPSATWKPLSEKMKIGNRNLITTYIKYLQDKDVLITFDNAIKFLKKENEKFRELT